MFDVADGRRLTGGEVFCEVEPAVPDGLRVDTQGNVWTSAGDGVQCFDSEGTMLGKILLPRTVANLTFGGPRKNRLFIAATDQVLGLLRGDQRSAVAMTGRRCRVG